MDPNHLIMVISAASGIGVKFMMDIIVKKQTWTPHTETFELLFDLLGNTCLKVSAWLRANMPSPAAVQGQVGAATTLADAAKAMEQP